MTAPDRLIDTSLYVAEIVLGGTERRLARLFDRIERKVAATQIRRDPRFETWVAEAKARAEAAS